MTADVVDTAEIRAAAKRVATSANVTWVRMAFDLCAALDCARHRNAELMNDRTEALNGEATQRGRAHAAEARIANALDVVADLRYWTSWQREQICSALGEPTP